MTGQCCATGQSSHPRARRMSEMSGSLVPGAVLVLLPKCPLCLAAWLTLATGFSFSAAGASWLRGSIMLLWATALVVVAWRRGRKVRQHR
jgi:hypothetical protein